MMLQKLKDDLKRLPEDRGFDEFKDVPVEGFSATLLAGYGWSEGMGIGKNAKENMKVFEYKRRTAKEGLGFVGDAPASRTKEKKEEKRGGTTTKKEEKIVRIVGGRDAGLKGSVVSTIGDDYLVLKLSESGEHISMDESREIIQGVSQDLLETAIPRRGGSVLVLHGKHKGAFGSLVERDLDREIAIVKDADTHELLNVKFEQIAEYIGDPSLLGH